jgi:rhodanese-related sulfurtransferase
MIFPRLFAKPAVEAAARDIGHDELERALREGSVVVVDVREPYEFAAGHIAGALNLPMSSFQPGDLPRDKPLALICQSGGRSAAALRAAIGAGHPNARHYPGGMSGWRALGGEVAT